MLYECRLDRNKEIDIPRVETKKETRINEPNQELFEPTPKPLSNQNSYSNINTPTITPFFTSFCSCLLINTDEGMVWLRRVMCVSFVFNIIEWNKGEKMNIFY